MLSRLYLFVIVLAGGCSSSTSSSSDGGPNGNPIRTEDMDISATVQATDDVTARVIVTLDDGDLLFATRYRLTGGDQLLACVAAACTTLESGNPLFEPLFPGGYSGTLPYVSNGEYTVAFTRGTGTNAPNSAVNLPPPFTITMPAEGEQVTDGETILIGWFPLSTAEPVRVDMGATCQHEDGISTPVFPGGVEIDTDEDGMAALSVDEAIESLSLFADTSAPAVQCDFEITVRHRQVGSIDPAYMSGGMRGDTERTVSLTYVPTP